jgi:hypothetical protein
VHSELILAHSEGWVRLMSDHQGCEVETVAGDGVGLVPSHSFGSPSPLIESRVFPTARRIGWINRFNPAGNLIRDQYLVSQTHFASAGARRRSPANRPFRENDTRANRSRALFESFEA